MSNSDETTPLPANHTTHTPGSPRTLNQFFASGLTSVLHNVDLATVGKVLLLTALVLLIYDLLVYLLASTSSRKRLLMTPWLTQILSRSWDDLSDRWSFARTDDAVGPLLKSLAQTAAKYEGRWEKSRLL
nr:uncharacterized protein LOC123768869 [Procambarus clarkii]